MRTAPVLVMLWSLPLPAATPGAAPPALEERFREDWRGIFVAACANQTRDGRWCDCVAEDVLERLSFEELLAEVPLAGVLEPAADRCNAIHGVAEEII